MIDIPSNCCDSAKLQLLLSEQLEPGDEKDVLRHMDCCPRCQRALEVTAADRQLWDDLPAHLSSRILLNHSGQEDTANHPPRATDSCVEQLGEYLGPTDHPNMLGRLGNYEICGIIGRGSTGIVVKAFEATLNRYVAIKILSPTLSNNAAARRRFEREGRAIAAVAHEHVVPIFAVDEFRGLPYIVMQYVAGASLQRRIELQGPLDTCEIVRIAMQVSAGLAAAHSQGIVHRDIKPANILLEHGLDRAMVTDFGLARVSDSASITVSSVVAGTPSFMAPEQARGESIDERSDLFSLGSVMYSMCTAYPPFRSETIYGLLRRICEDEPRPIREINPQIPEWLSAFVDKLHAKAKDDRFDSAEQVSQLLRHELAHLQSPTSISTPARPWFVPRASTSARLAIILTGAIAAALLVAIYAVGWNVYDQKPVSADSQVPIGRNKQANVERSTERMVAGREEFECAEERTFPATASGQLIANVDAGNIEVTTSDQQQITFRSVHILSAADKEEADKLTAKHKLDFTSEGSTLNFAAKFDHDDEEREDHGERRFRRIEFKICLPKTYNIKLSSASGNLSANDLNGKAQMRSSSGNLNLTQVQGLILAKTAGGNINLTACGSEADLDTLGGNILVRDCDGYVRAKTAGGNLLIENANDGIDAQTLGGNIQAAISDKPKKDCKLTAQSGGIQVRLDKQLAINVAATAHSGLIVAPFHSEIQKSNGQRSLHDVLNGGGPLLSATTQSGNIEFEYLTK
jgi:eukaryotic-like serine/threonine-protein kinase